MTKKPRYWSKTYTDATSIEFDIHWLSNFAYTLTNNSMKGTTTLLRLILAILRHGHFYKGDMLCLGKSGYPYNRDIARHLGITPASLKVYLRMLITWKVLIRTDRPAYYKINTEIIKITF